MLLLVLVILFHFFNLGLELLASLIEQVLFDLEFLILGLEAFLIMFLQLGNFLFVEIFDLSMLG